MTRERRKSGPKDDVFSDRSGAFLGRKVEQLACRVICQSDVRFLNRVPLEEMYQGVPLTEFLFLLIFPWMNVVLSPSREVCQKQDFVSCRTDQMRSLV